MARAPIVVASLLVLVGCGIEGPDEGASWVPSGDADDVEQPADGGSDAGEALPGEPPPSVSPEDPPAPEEPEEPPPPPPEPENQGVCYPGPNDDDSVCLPVVPASSLGSGYNYPSSSSAQYAPPTHYVDLDAADPNLQIAKNFTLGELMQAYKGKYGVYQPHAVARLQAVRTATGGALTINSGYRNPSYNASVGGASLSRHMYGDAADMASGAVSLGGLRDACLAQNASYTQLYTSHVHCDWRNAPLDEVLYGPPMQAMVVGGTEVADSADLLVDADGTLHAFAPEMDEGEPYREWTAFDADGYELEVVAAEDYLPPGDAAFVEVMVGGQHVVSFDLATGDALELPASAVQVRLPTLPVED